MSQDVIVIGLGAMGASTLYHLAKRGVRVTGIEQFQIGHSFGSSHGQSRVIRKAYFEHPNYVPLLESSYKLWAEFSNKIGKKIYHETGLIYFCPEDSGLLAGLFESSKKYGIEVSKLSPRELIPFQKQFNIPKGFLSVLEPQAGYLESDNCISGYTELAKTLGAKILSDEKVLSWKSEKNRVEVKTNKGIYSADRLVITAGAWSKKILENLGLNLKIIKKTMFWFPATDAYKESMGMPCFLYELPYGSFYGFPKGVEVEDGLKVAEHSGSSETKTPETLDRGLDPQHFSNAKRFIQEAFLGVTDKLIEFKTCMYTMTPDENFILDIHPNHSNVSFAAGFSGHGFKFSSVIGEIMADLATSGSTAHSIDFLRMRH
jgi:sarcosine oxidase